MMQKPLFPSWHYALIAAISICSMPAALNPAGAPAVGAPQGGGLFGLLREVGEATGKAIGKAVEGVAYLAKQLDGGAEEVDFAVKVYNEIRARCTKNIVALYQGHTGRNTNPIQIDPIAPGLNTIVTTWFEAITPGEISNYKGRSNQVVFSDMITSVPSKDFIYAKELLEKTRDDISAALFTKGLQPKPGATAGDVANSMVEAIAKGQAEVNKAAATAAINAEASKEKLNTILNFAQDPKKLAAGVGAGLVLFGGGIALKQLLPRLLAKKPQIISEMSFLTPYERLMGKKLPPSNFDQIVFTKDTGPQIMRAVAHIRRVVQSEGELMNLIFFGPPGTGKTMTAKAIARTVGADYMLINASAFEQLTPGEAVAELEATFRLMRSNKKPVLVFFDEADAIMGKRGGDKGTATSLRVINTFLANVTDTHNRKYMFVLATNLPKSLDAAVLSRFPEEGWLYFGRPSEENRATILHNYLQQFFNESNFTISEEVLNNMPLYAKQLPKATGRDLRAIARSIADRMIDEQQAEPGKEGTSTVLTDTMVKTTLQDIEANRQHFENYNYEVAA